MGGIFRGLDCRSALGHDGIDSQSHQFRRELRQGILFAVGKTILEGDVLPFDPAVFLQSLNYGLERPYRLGCLRAGGKEEADTAACLRARNKRPGRRCTGDERDDLAPPHRLPPHAEGPAPAYVYIIFLNEAATPVCRAHVSFGSWLCGNAATRERGRRNVRLNCR